MCGVSDESEYESECTSDEGGWARERNQATVALSTRRKKSRKKKKKKKKWKQEIGKAEQ